MRKSSTKIQIALTRWSDCWSDRRLLKKGDQVARFFAIVVIVAFFFAWHEVPCLKIRHVVIVIVLRSCDDVSTRWIAAIVARLGLARRRG